jgi:hypothetical protein
MNVGKQTLRASVLAMLFAGVWTVGCGAESPEVPGDDDDDENGGTGMGGTFPQGGASGGTFPQGGASGGTFPQGGTSGGTSPQGGTGTGGTFPQGGTTGGSGGSGMMCGPTMAAPGDTAISDLEAGTNAINPPRVGYWYTYNDGSTTCAQMPPPDPSGATPFPPTAAAGNGMYAARTTGGACGTWGAGMGFDLANCMSMSTPYNASAFNGISFWYKSTTAVRVIVSATNVIPTTRGGTCTPGAGMGMECDNGHGLDLPANTAGGMMAVPFTMLSQSFGQMKPFDKTAIVNIQWQVANGMAFDFTIDDVMFTP